MQTGANGYVVDSLANVMETEAERWHGKDVCLCNLWLDHVPIATAMTKEHFCKFNPQESLYTLYYPCLTTPFTSVYFLFRPPPSHTGLSFQPRDRAQTSCLRS